MKTSWAGRKLLAGNLVQIMEIISPAHANCIRMVSLSTGTQIFRTATNASHREADRAKVTHPRIGLLGARQAIEFYLVARESLSRRALTRVWPRECSRYGCPDSPIVREGTSEVVFDGCHHWPTPEGLPFIGPRRLEIEIGTDRRTIGPVRGNHHLASDRSLIIVSRSVQRTESGKSWKTPSKYLSHRQSQRRLV